MGQPIDAQSIVVASTATRRFSHEVEILRGVVLQSVALACLVGPYLRLQACVWPFTLMVVHRPGGATVHHDARDARARPGAFHP